jgi:hypothetical protein
VSAAASAPPSSRGSTSWRGVALTSPPASASSALVARARRCRIALADQAADRLRSRRQLAHVRLALDAVTVEQIGRRLARPAGTAASFQARLTTSRTPWHMPWPRERRLLMRRVAGDEDTAGAPALGDQRMEAVAALTPQLAFVARDPALEQLPGSGGGYGLDRALAVLERDFPAAMVLRADHVRAWPVGLAVLDAVLRQPAPARVR